MSRKKVSTQGISSDYTSMKNISLVKIKLHDRQRLGVYLLVLCLALITFLSMPTIVPANFKFSPAFSSFFANLQTMFLQPHLGNDSLKAVFYALLQSIALAILTTILGALIAFFLSLLAARNLSPVWLSLGVQSLMAFIRAIPTIIWVLIYSISLGLGSNAAVLGLLFHSVAYLTKVYADSFEDIAPEVIDSLRAMGINLGTIIMQVIIPTSYRRMLSWTFIRFEINFGDAIAVGAAAGAGGIGYQLFMSSTMYFDFHEVGFLVYFVLAFAVILEFLSYQLRTRFNK
ncbi:PhnE/PtxC family ABC transporter permease [Liquorilactobacillus satsumensis]|uniref:PhnE/PtxC family ABC transporter permease n=1 Tax=Liquorilactobacillus satsumensis TaxID=259059 RepID=UPI001E4D0DD0|nr:ABC transporter permease subunit [Liquorilactobacillus satsumensis]